MVAALLLAGPARAARPEDALIKEGAGLFNSGHYEDSIAVFHRAYERDPRLTKALLLIGAAHINLGHLPEGLTFYERYRRETQAMPPADQERLRGYFEEAAAQVEEALRREPRRADLYVLLIRIHGDLGREDEVASDRQRMREALAPPPPPPAPRPPPPPPPPPPVRPRWRFAVGGAAGLAGLGIAGLGISALAVNGGCIDPQHPGGCTLDYATTGIGAGLLAGGLALAVGGAVLVALPPRRGPHQEKARR